MFLTFLFFFLFSGTLSYSFYIISFFFFFLISNVYFTDVHWRWVEKKCILFNIFLDLYLICDLVLFAAGQTAHFKIDPDTGWISVKSRLDRDEDTLRNTGGVYAMTVMVL